MLKESTKLQIILLIMLVALPTFSTNLYISALPSMVALFHTNSASIQQSLVSFTYGFAICMLLSGVLADSLGRRNTILCGIFIYCITSVLILFSHHLLPLILLRFLQGIGGCCGTVVARVIVRDKFSDQQSLRIFALLSSGMAVAFIMAPIVGSFLVHLFSWKACFIFMFTLGLIILFLAFFFLSDEKKHTKKINPHHIFSGYFRAARSKLFLTHTLTISITWSGFFLIMMEYPFIIMHQLKLSVVVFGVIFSIILCGYLIGSRIARLLSKQGVSSNSAVMYGITIMFIATFFAVIMLTEMDHSRKMSEIILIAGGFLYLLGMGIQIPNSQFAAIPPQEKGSAIITSLLYFIEMIIVALLSNLFKTYFSINAVTLWCALLMMILVLWMGYCLVMREEMKMLIVNFSSRI